MAVRMYGLKPEPGLLLVACADLPSHGEVSVVSKQPRPGDAALDAVLQQQRVAALAGGAAWHERFSAVDTTVLRAVKAEATPAAVDGAGQSDVEWRCYLLAARPFPKSTLSLIREVRALKRRFKQPGLFAARKQANWVVFVIAGNGNRYVDTNQGH